MKPIFKQGDFVFYNYSKIQRYPAQVIALYAKEVLIRYFVQELDSSKMQKEEERVSLTELSAM